MRRKMEVLVSLFDLKMATRSWPRAKGKKPLFLAGIRHSVGVLRVGE